jgi:hypothetical protein
MLFYKYTFLSGKPFDLFFQQQMEGLNEQTAERGVLLERARQVSTHSTPLFTNVQRRCSEFGAPTSSGFGGIFSN